MNFVSMSKARASLAALIDAEQRSIITRNGEPAAVLMDFEEYRAMRADLLLLRDRTQLEAVVESIAAVRSGDGARFHEISELAARLEVEDSTVGAEGR